MSNISSSDPDNTLIVKLGSTLRIGDVTTFKAETDALLTAAPGKTVVCDAAAVEFIDAAALQLLVAMGQACVGQQRSFVIGTPSVAFLNAVNVSGYGTLLGLST